jgi:pectin methylesterase-like acyl-CoA thioesterase
MPFSILISSSLGLLPGSNALQSGSNPIHANSSFIMVPDNYTTIQAAVDAASNGMTILVRNGTYHEHV